MPQKQEKGGEMNPAIAMCAECDVPLLSTAEATKRIVRLTVATTEDADGERLPLNMAIFAHPPKM